MVERGGFEPPKATPTDLQSAPFGRSGTSPLKFTQFFIIKNYEIKIKCDFFKKIGFFDYYSIFSYFFTKFLKYSKILSH